MPTTKADDEVVEEMYAGVDELLKHTKPHGNVIIMGNFNAIVGEGREGREVEDFGLEKINEKGERLEEFCRENGLVITNTWFQNPTRKIYIEYYVYCMTMHWWKTDVKTKLNSVKHPRVLTVTANTTL